MWSVNDLALYVYDQSGNLRGQANAVNLPGLTGKTERVAINLPSAGLWRVSVRSWLGATGQPFAGVVQFGRAHYGDLRDTYDLEPSMREDIYGDIRSFTMWPIGSRFRPDFSVSRLDLATALFLSSRIPQYAANWATYQDVTDASSRLFVESVQSAPAGALFLDSTQGGRFRPHDGVTRLVAAVALVRAAGLRNEAEGPTAPLVFLDAASIPTQFRGYVSVAVSRGLIQSDVFFRPQSSFTRADLAHAVAVIQTRATQ